MFVILFCIWFTYILIKGLSVTALCFWWSWISDSEYDPSDNSDSSFHVGAHLVNSKLIAFI